MTKKQLLISALVAFFGVNSVNTASLDKKTIERPVCTFNDNGLLTKISNGTVGRKMTYLAGRHFNVTYKFLMPQGFKASNKAVEGNIVKRYVSWLGNAIKPQGLALIDQARAFGLKDVDGNKIHGAANYAHWIGHYLNINRLLRGNDLNDKVITGCAQSHYVLKDGYDLIQSITSNAIECSVLTSHDELTLSKLKSLHWSNLPVHTSTAKYPTANMPSSTEGYFVYGFIEQFNRGATKVVHIEVSESRINYALQAQRTLREQGFDVVVIKYNKKPETIALIKQELGIK